MPRRLGGGPGCCAEQCLFEIGGVKLTGSLNFDCGAFRFGTLFADTRIDGEAWTNGRTVFRDDLGLPPSDRP